MFAGLCMAVLGQPSLCHTWEKMRTSEDVFTKYKEAVAARMNTVAILVRYFQFAIAIYPLQTKSLATLIRQPLYFPWSLR